MTATALRPLSLGGLLEQTFRYYGKHFWLFIGIMALPEAMFCIAAQGVLLPVQSWAKAVPLRNVCTGAINPSFVLFWAEFGALMLISFVVFAFVFGASTAALSEVHLGRSTSIGGAFGSMRGKILKLIGLLINIGIRVFVLYVIFAASAIAMIYLMGLTARHGHRGPVLIAGYVLAGLFFVSAVFFPVFCLLRYSLAVPALVLENLKPGEAIRRGITLARGSLWRILIAALLMFGINWAALFCVEVPFLIALVRNQLTGHTGSSWLLLSTNIATGLAAIITAPLLIIILALLYYDARVRKEGFALPSPATGA